MISDKTSPYRLDSEYFSRCVDVIERSGAAELIEAFYGMARGAGGRPPAGRRYTIKAVLVTQLAIIGVSRVPSLAETHRVICTLDDDQLVAVGMDPEQRQLGAGEYPRFRQWWGRMLEPLDPTGDLPAQRVTNKKHKDQLAARTEAEQLKAELAHRRLHDVFNRIIAGSSPGKWCISLPLKQCA